MLFCVCMCVYETWTSRYQLKEFPFLTFLMFVMLLLFHIFFFAFNLFHLWTIKKYCAEVKGFSFSLCVLFSLIFPSIPWYNNFSSIFFHYFYFIYFYFENICERKCFVLFVGWFFFILFHCCITFMFVVAHTRSMRL